jgi:hypothetical protein
VFADRVKVGNAWYSVPWRLIGPNWKPGRPEPIQSFYKGQLVLARARLLTECA